MEDYDLQILDSWEAKFWEDIKDRDPATMSKNQYKHFTRIRIKMKNTDSG